MPRFAPAGRCAPRSFLAAMLAPLSAQGARSSTTATSGRAPIRMGGPQ
jgi:hypothetical protein